MNTKKDIADIKKANHELIFERTAIKNDLIKSFENKKSLLDNELSKLVSNNNNAPLETLLDDDKKELLNEMKLKLKELKDINKNYARFVVVVSEFYNTLLDQVFPREMDGYQKSKHSPATLLKVRA